jgi:hypothetical protein
MRLPPSIADLRRLGLSAPCSSEELKAAWRRAVSELHPDRPGSDQKQRAAAMAEVNAAYQRLCDFKAQHGRLPGLPEVVAQQPLRKASPRNNRQRHVWVTLTLAAALTLVFWPLASPEEASTSVQPNEGRQSGSAAENAAVTTDTFVDLDLPTFIDVGVSKDDVLRLAGPPLFQSEAVWEYGPSEVHFEKDLVVRWHNSPLRPLPVQAGDAGISP